ncbi:3-isopropylmalate dehydratase large subunit [Tsuneonella suprasediminis]|uniref:3-isopropylmalate dehydratase n=1 Tax=Tsuneonella suprasediminis TaxID=2306996 RepID=A0A419R3L8_9SPHN|nr:3-isopropylmalate dehydratase large subunit [Tsuneonella suprasediminis]RJX69125.1 3-isopropylmalate dehydratase large subunit [Tsuneonella suprasediminis]
MTAPRTMLDKIWDAHVVRDLGDDWVLLQIDRHVLHDLSGPPALDGVRRRGLRVRNPDLVFATPDHIVSSAPGRTGHSFAPGGELYDNLKAWAREAGVHYFDLGEEGQGIVHVIAPEQGIALPGVTLICGDSHTCTNGGLGALAFGVGTSQSLHALATGTLRMQRPKRMRIRVDGDLPVGVTPKDVILHLLCTLGASAAVEHSIEFAGSAIRGLSVDGRLTLCNLSVEMGGRSGMVAPDDTVFDWIAGRRFAPAGADFDRAVNAWRALHSDEEAVFDRDMAIAAEAIAPTITWGTSPDHAIAIDGVVPDPDTAADVNVRDAMHGALGYMGLTPGQRIVGTPVDWVFIGSCTNSRISDLRDAARIARGHRVAPGVQAWVVPGSVAVKRQAEDEGLDRVFTDAGFQWREPGCSMCVAANGERVPPGARCVSTSNRNFVGRQGPQARTHLASPATAAAAAIRGAITDVRSL